jgi:hypothetical protein
VHLAADAIPRETSPGFGDNGLLPVAVHVGNDRAHADSEGTFATHRNVLMRNPLVGALRFMPIQPLRTWLTPPDHEIEMTVAVDIHQCGEAIVALEAVVLGKCQVDEVVPETDFSSSIANAGLYRKRGLMAPCGGNLNLTSR